MISIIRPIMPAIPGQLLSFNSGGWAVFVGMLAISLISIFVAFCISRYAANKYEGNKVKTAWLFIGITAFVTMGLFCFFGCTAITLKGIILSLVFILSSFEDIKTRECDDFLHVMIVIAAFIGTELIALPGMLLSAVFVFAMMIGTILITKGDIGGADIKMATACAFLLGLRQGLLGLVIGLTLAVIFNLIKNRKNKKAGFPMIPYLAVGFMTAFFI